MGIWIRSQDKEVLTECISFWHDNSLPFCEGYHIRSDDFCLGTYSTKDKALKVLDMMQEHINDINYFGEVRYGTDYEGTIATPNLNVFQMPSDDKV